MGKYLIGAFAVTFIGGCLSIAVLLFMYSPVGTMLKPSITGDRAADATCMAAVAPFIENGQPQVGKLIAMSEEDRRSIANELYNASRDVTFPDIKEAAKGVMGGLAIAVDSDNVFMRMAHLEAFARLGVACRAHGWDVQKAGLVSE